MLNSEHPTTDMPPLGATIEHEYPPCAVCGGPNDVGEVCADCAKTNDPLFGVDLEGPGGWMVQDGRDRI